MLKGKWLFLGLIILVSFSSCGIFYPCHCPKFSKTKVPVSTQQVKIS